MGKIDYPPVTAFANEIFMNYHTIQPSDGLPSVVLHPAPLSHPAALAIKVVCAAIVEGKKPGNSAKSLISKGFQPVSIFACLY